MKCSDEHELPVGMNCALRAQEPKLDFFPAPCYNAASKKHGKEAFL